MRRSGPSRPAGSRAGRLGAVVWAAVAVLLAGCSQCGGAEAGRSEAADAPPDAGAAELSIRLRPERQPPGLWVRWQLSGPKVAGVKTLAVTKRWAGQQGLSGISSLQVADDSGPLGAEIVPAEGRAKLARPARGQRLSASYRVAAGAGGSRLDLQVDRHGVSGIGHRLLLLPELNQPLRTRLQWDLSALDAGAAEPAPAAACSLGVGPDVVGTVSPPDLMNSIYVAGRLQVLDGGFGERLVARGSHRLDLGEVLRLTGQVLYEGRKLFRPPTGREQSGPLAVFLLPAPGLGGNHEGASLTQSLGLWFDEQRTFDGDLRLALAHELLHRYLGGWLSLADRSDTKWFSEGFTEHYARVVLWRLSALSAADFARHVNRLQRAQQAALDGSGQPALGPAYFRGALYALRLDAQLQRAGDSLDELLRRLAELARRSGGAPAELSWWRQQLGQRLGPPAVDELERLVIRAEAPIELPAGALGPCFELVTGDAVHFDLGFDESSLSSEPALIRGLRPDSAAARAGLRDGDLVLAAPKVLSRDPEHPLELLVSGRAGSRSVRFKPARSGLEWRPKPSCHPPAVR